MINSISIEEMIEEVDSVITEYEKKANETGENFNLFNILEIDSWENGHSKILAELLNPRGTHGNGSIFLKVFCDKLGLSDSDIEIEHATVETEKFIGFINEEYNKGGYIDIFISDKQNNRIIIENKIYATDQKNQLLRYHNFGKEKGGKTELFYLSLWEDNQPSAYSLGELTSKDYKIISYEKHIIGWLEECKKVSILNVVNETITQYSNILKQLTKQTTMDDMNKKIKEIILGNPKRYINAIEKAWEVQQEIVGEISQSLTNKMAKIYMDEKIILRDPSKWIKIQFFNENDGVWFGYSMYEKNEKILGAEAEKKISSILLDVIKEKGHLTSGANHNYIAWFYPSPFHEGNKFIEWKKEEMFKYAKETDLNDFIDKLIEQEKLVRQLFLERLQRANEI